jgi:uncharacterized membrane protein
MSRRIFDFPSSGLSREKNLVLILIAVLIALLFWNVLWNFIWLLLKLALFAFIVYLIYQVLKRHI